MYWYVSSCSQVNWNINIIIKTTGNKKNWYQGQEDGVFPMLYVASYNELEQLHM